MEFGVLGSVEAWHNARPLALGGASRRCLLGVLLLDAGRVVPLDKLVELVWGQRPPAAARNAVATHVSRLRKILSADPGAVISAQGAGYVIEVERENVDVHRFRRLVGQARAAADLSGARELWHEALELWRGPVMAGVVPAEMQHRLCAGLEEERLAALEERLDADLRLGRSAEVSVELAHLVGEHPLRERLVELWMTALYRSGRQADALAVYRQTHARMVDELGIEPGHALRTLHRRILSGDPPAEPNAEPKAGPKAGPKAELRAGPKAGPKAELRADPNAEPRAESKADPKDEPRADPKDEPGADPTADPTADPKAEPKAEPAAGGAARREGRPAQLPPAVAAFTGRVESLRRLDAVLDGGDEHPGTVMISLITGTAGVGKTELAIQWGHRVRARFPDGQLYVNLRGHATGEPMRPIEALSLFLRSLGVPPEQVPTDEGEATALYRTVLTDRRVLVVLDNASTVDQVRPLLPGGPGCLVVVTSRDRHLGLVAREGASRIDLEVFTPDESRALLAAIVGAARVDAEPDAATELADLCAQLPLALRVAAAHLNSRPRHGIAAYVADLRAGDRLTALTVSGDELSGMRATFDLSYALLSTDARRMFGLLGVAPGIDVTAGAASALAGIAQPRAVELLDQLTTAHLLGEHLPGRFAFHDLLRLYAAEKAATVGDRQAALSQLCHWYLLTAHRAAQALYPHMLRLTIPLADNTPTVAGTGPGPTGAAGWLDAERRNLVAAIHHEAEHGSEAVAFQLADVLRGYFFLRRHITDWLEVGRVQEELAPRLGGDRAQAAAQLTLGEAYLRHGRYTEAMAHLRSASTLSKRADWPVGRTASLGGMATVHLRSGHTRQAANECARVVAMLRTMDNTASLANNLGNLSLMLCQLGDLRQAADHYTEAIAIFRKIESRVAETVSLMNLGMIYHDLGEFETAFDNLAHALALHREIGDRGNEAETLSGLAVVLLDLGWPLTALDLARDALALARETDQRYTEAYALQALADVKAHLGEHREALELHRQARRLATDTSNRHLQIAASIGIASDHRLLGELDQATVHADEALAAARQAGYLVLEGRSANVRAEIELAMDRPQLAEDFARKALAGHLKTGHRPGEARSRHLLETLARKQTAS